MVEKFKLDAEDISKFYRWINLNLESVTWFGKYKQEFDRFLEILLSEDLELKRISNKINFCLEYLESGPVKTWIKWIKDKLICYCFVFKELDIKQISQEFDISYKDLSFIFRNFFSEIYPKHENYFSDVFLIRNIDIKNETLTIVDIKEALGIKKIGQGRTEDEMLCDFEITLYEEWKHLLIKLEEIYRRPKLVNSFYVKFLKNLKSKKYFVEFFACLAISCLLILGIKEINIWYEKNINTYINLFERDFSWSKIIFPDTGSKLVNTKSIKDIEDIEKPGMINFDLGVEEQDERYETETDTMLASVENLPIDFSSVDSELSIYEELVKGGYKDERHGSRKVYKIMLKSVNIDRSRKKLNFLLNKYKAKKVSKVHPGTVVPGGVYYNVYIEKDWLSEFLDNVQSVDESVLFLSKTKRKNPPGKAKIFIWVKKI